jgi:glutathione synthase/RimK-type ligase-like ATP-grasp enzyme
MMLHALGIYRETQFSPGKVDADAAILDTVLAHLADRGVRTATVDPFTFADDRGARRYDLILAMCQDEPALRGLTAAANAGALVINSPEAIRSCYRDRLGPILSKAALPVPAGMLAETAAPIDWYSIAPLDPDRGIFVKRGDLHALIPEDVRRADGRGALAAVLRDFASRGVRLAYLQQAVEGRVIKFYGVTGGSYFTVADLETGTSGPLSERLRDAAQRAARALGLEVWGGDAIVSGGHFNIVDFNDWPSFERVRTSAAAAIAARALELLAMRASG